LQTTRQGRNEIPREFADRCRWLAQKIMAKTRSSGSTHTPRKC
jgi:hypothetical protein